MSVSRRRLFHSLALAAGATPAATSADPPAITLEVLRNVSVAHGTNLSDERLRVLKPVLERRISQLRALRDFEFEDTVAPTHGIL